MPSFKKKFSEEKRTEEAVRIKKKYPDRIPVIVEKAEGSQIQDLDKKKYLVPLDLTVGQFIYVIRKRIKLEPDQAIYLFVNDILPPTSMLMSHIYKEHSEVCGFLFCTYDSESTFGS